MKRCPQCSSVFEDNVSFCANDGATLIDEHFVLPSEQIEEDTIIRTNPIIVNLENEERIPNQISQVEPQAENIIVVPAQNASANRNYLLFLVVGLLIGGFLVLAALMFSRGYFSNEKVAVNTAGNRENTAIEESAVEDENVFPSAGEKHSETNASVDEDELNGRVITLNAYVRSAPNANAAEIDVLPENDRIQIIERENDKSPWYKVVCEHGTSGWMHGNTIEFTDGY